jgi:hypothetical protein
MILGLLRRSTPRDCGWNSPIHADIALISELRKNSRLARALTLARRTRFRQASSRDYGPAKLVAASGRTEGYLGHSTRKSAIAAKTVIAAQITTPLVRRSLSADSEAFDVESVVVTNLSCPKKN